MEVSRYATGCGELPSAGLTKIGDSNVDRAAAAVVV